MSQPQVSVKEEALPIQIKDGAESSEVTSATGRVEAVLPDRIKEEEKCSEATSITEDESASKEALPFRIKDGAESPEASATGDGEAALHYRIKEEEESSEAASVTEDESASKEVSPVRDEASSTAAAPKRDEAAYLYCLMEEVKALNLKEKDWTEEDEYPPDEEPEEEEEPVEEEELIYLGPMAPETVAKLDRLKNKVSMFYNDMVIVREHLQRHTRRIVLLREDLAVGIEKMQEVQEGMKKLAEELGLKNLNTVSPTLTDVVLDLWLVMDNAKYLAQFDYEGPERELEPWEIRKEEALHEERRIREMRLWMNKRLWELDKELWVDEEWWVLDKGLWVDKEWWVDNRLWVLDKGLWVDKGMRTKNGDQFALNQWLWLFDFEYIE